MSPYAELTDSFALLSLSSSFLREFSFPKSNSLNLNERWIGKRNKIQAPPPPPWEKTPKHFPKIWSNGNGGKREDEGI